tara:strand:- start:346 stop:516 length:171 start_codon:yes stop_codon:yes gene_type:complete
VDSVKELKANQKYVKVVEKIQKTEAQLLELREKKRQLATNIHDEYHEPSLVSAAGN